MASEKDSTGGATPSNGKAARARTEVGGVRSSDDPAPDLWFGQPTGERRDATCSAVGKRSKELVTAHLGYQRHKRSGVANPDDAAATAAAEGTRKAGCGKTARPV